MHFLTRQPVRASWRTQTPSPASALLARTAWSAQALGMLWACGASRLMPMEPARPESSLLAKSRVSSAHLQLEACLTRPRLHNCTVCMSLSPQGIQAMGRSGHPSSSQSVGAHPQPSNRVGTQPMLYRMLHNNLDATPRVRSPLLLKSLQPLSSR